MSRLFEELDYRQTPIGALSLRRRRELSLGVDVFEIKLGDEFLMSSLFTASEIALARLGLAALVRPESNEALDVVVGGLGLGYTAQAVLEHKTVGSLIVVEALQPVIDWHVAGLVPLGRELAAEPRCRFVLGDFFALAASPAGFDAASPGRAFDAVLVDIDHSPDALLDCGQRRLLRRSGPHPAGGASKARRRVRSVVERACRRRLHRAAGARVRGGARRAGDVSQSAAKQAVHADGLSRAQAGVAAPPLSVRNLSPLEAEDIVDEFVGIRFRDDQVRHALVIRPKKHLQRKGGG